MSQCPRKACVVLVTMSTTPRPRHSKRSNGTSFRYTLSIECFVKDVGEDGLVNKLLCIFVRGEAMARVEHEY